MILASALFLANLAACVPAWWPEPEPATLRLLDTSPVNCLLVAAENWSKEFVRAAEQRRVRVLAVLRPSGEAPAAARHALEAGAAGLILEGEFTEEEIRRISAMAAAASRPVVKIAPRSALRLDAAEPVLATDQGVWPGIRMETDGKVRAAPSGGPWIDTNAGFLRFLRAAVSATVWIAVRPPEGVATTAERLIQAAADAEISGARWVVCMDPDLWERLKAGDSRAAADWEKLNRHLRFYEDHAEWRSWRPAGELAIVEGPADGALLAGNLVDMVVVKHTPVRAVAAGKVRETPLDGLRLAVVVNPKSLSDHEQEVLREFRRRGGTTLTGPEGWRMPPLSPGQMALSEPDLKRTEQMWKEINSLIWRRNLGVRLFNVSTALSELLAEPGGKRKLLHLVNYSDYPLESITVYFAGKYVKATLYDTESGSKELPVYEVDEGTGVEIETVRTLAALVVE